MRQLPSSYMRARRPHLFSDSVKRIDVSLSKEVLSHHLETLTKQKSEAVFEGFAKRLVEKFVAPNLRPQTGPTGGGDGKTDAETYPVSKEISERWFAADQAAANERWAFAFSAKEDWRGKVRSDVKEITSTARGYPRVYFITNQYAPARQSAEVQDVLEKEFGVPVTILDRTWLLDCVFERDSLSIAHETLGVGNEVEVTQLGPRDLKRQTELNQLEQQIADPSKYEGRSTALADDALRAAKLARGLEKPRFEVDGRYERAVRIARERRLQTQHLAAVYEWAWTSYFWFDDAYRTSELYDQVEKLAIASRDAGDLEKLSNLLPLLVSAVNKGFLSEDDGQIDKRNAALVAALEEAKSQTARPNNSLHAHAMLLLHKITSIRRDDDVSGLDETWNEFTSVIEQSTGLGRFPFESIAATLTQLGDILPDSPAFDRLYEALTDALANRKQEGEAAKLNSERGYQKLRKQLPYDAIRWFGRAVSDLIKAEYEDELVEALCGCSIAYLKAGLYWAARNYALAAATTELRKFKVSGSADDVNPAVLSQWFECELQLGRVPFVLTAYELDVTIRYARSRTEKQAEFAEELRIEQGHRISALVIGTSFEDLKRLGKFPAALDRLGLLQVSTTLLFLMGGEQALRDEAVVPAEETTESIEDLFDQLAGAGKSAELPSPDFFLDEKNLLRSRVLGCEVTAACENNLTSIGIAEAILGALESLLATSLNLKMFPHLDRLNIRVQSKEDADITPVLEFVEESGSTVALVTHRPELRYATREEALGFPRWLQEAVVRLFVSFAESEDFESWGDTVLREENGFARAITFSNTPIAYSEIFGDTIRLDLDRWVEDGDPQTEVKRSSAWSAKQSEPLVKSEPIVPGVGEPSPGWLDGEAKRHSDYRIMSPIDQRKWDAARWCGTFFMCSPGSRMAPVFGLGFEEKGPAAAIMEAWRERFGESDPDNNLRIAVITGINISNPHAYAVIVGPNMDRLKSSPSEMVVGFVSRINVMTPTDSRNLDMFLSEFHRLKRFRLVAAHIVSKTMAPEPASEIALEKFDIIVRPAWTISENDPDGVALNPDDPPVVPIGQANPPVLKALEQKARFRASRLRPKNNRPTSN
ncbi:hypothetical protein [Bradyrhizobium sp. SZCCHNS2015]|uniref:hypothetical protein n=1 Tax=Bradyrhizobium sp. SZCCHNS2015 TaxID=3057305 RepID=UPI0028EC3E80|nr:hypothetical protein [Bradyrhizobium sp. SZCCHNS2015]